MMIENNTVHIQSDADFQFVGHPAGQPSTQPPNVSRSTPPYNRPLAQPDDGCRAMPAICGDEAASDILR
ncbi:unnamed protein product [Haemonchus placei]|uniref:Uncharacterized protein n=1 Tax=Haemonchus placei TaxID=6290 RepID=A0A0N4WNW3_HAEPC|nr:unnamed protein product [Haemonchus placei]